MRVLYLLFLLPLGAFASCPAGIQLSNVPISTALPYCVKWESSALGGCTVDCKGVCVEFPVNGTKGPMETTGAECELGGGSGGDDGGGGDSGGNTGGAPYYYPFKDQISPIGVGGQYQEATTAALKQIDEDLRWTAIKMYGQGEQSLATFKDFSKDLRKVTDALNTQIIGSEQVGLINNQMLSSLHRSEDWLQELTLCITRPLDYNCGHLAGSGGGSGGGTNTYDELKQFHTDMVGANFAEYNSGASMYGKLSSMGYDILSMRDRVHTMASDVGNMYQYVLPDLRNNSIEMNRNVRDIAEAIKGGGGGTGGEGQGVDYSKMPGAADNPLHVAGAEYKSGLCQEGDNCALDLGKINKQYDDKKTVLKDKYGAIKDEVSQVFKFQFSGSASAPKCFDMFSIFGKSYQVCPDSDGYWDFLAALMMFIFYFTAFIVLTRR